jgi:hypothetical protein
MRNVARWLKRRFGTFDLLPEYFTAAIQQMQNILWGALLPFVAWGIWFIVSTPPTSVNVVAIGLALFMAGYYVWRADHLRLARKISITGLRVQEWTIIPRGSIGEGHPARSYYLEIVNESDGTTIGDVSVQLRHISPEVPNLNWLPIHLHVKHDNPVREEDYVRSFNLNPHETKNIDFVSSTEGDNRFTVIHIVPGVNKFVFFDTKGHRLQVIVTAKDMPAVSIWVRVWRDEAGLLMCEIEK